MARILVLVWAIVCAVLCIAWIGWVASLVPRALFGLLMLACAVGLCIYNVTSDRS